MLLNNFEIRVLVKGRPINEYPHNGKRFIEGRDGSNFEIEFINRTNVRVEAVLAVDGLSVIDGKDAGPQSSGYLVDAYGSVRIPGWKLTDEQVAAFVFSGKKQSYAQQSTGSARNTGVIGALVFAEKPVHRPIHHTYGGGIMRGMTPMSGGWVGGDSTGGPIIGASLSGIALGAVSNNMSYSTEVAAASASPTIAKGIAQPQQLNFVEQTLGTGFGEATEFETTSVSFNRGELVAQMVLYYDDSRGLRARGIVLDRRQPRRVDVEPQAFPAMSTGCTPPPGWEGQRPRRPRRSRWS